MRYQRVLVRMSCAGVVSGLMSANIELWPECHAALKKEEESTGILVGRTTFGTIHCHTSTVNVIWFMTANAPMLNMFEMCSWKQNKAKEIIPMFYHWSLLAYTGELVYRIALHACIHIAAVGNWNHGSSIHYNSEILYTKFQSIHTNVASTSSHSWTVLMLHSWLRYAWTRIPTCSLLHQTTNVMK